jgi:hypothetical protein
LTGNVEISNYFLLVSSLKVFTLTDFCLLCCGSCYRSLAWFRVAVKQASCRVDQFSRSAASFLLFFNRSFLISRFVEININREYRSKKALTCSAMLIASTNPAKSSNDKY